MSEEKLEQVRQRKGSSKTKEQTLFFGAAMGSENPKNGSARFMNPFLKVSSFLFP